MIKAGIIGAAGYTGGEVLRLLLRHPQVELVFAQSTSNAGVKVSRVHTDLYGDTDIEFCEKADVLSCDIVFLCGGHGSAQATIDSFPAEYCGRIIDLGNDFRLKADAGDFVYGLTDCFKGRIVNARHIANPGCFATAIQLALLPLAKEDLLGEIHVTALTGATGAGQKLQESTAFNWRDNNISVYKAFTHQHLGEICETLSSLAPSWNGKINFVPVRGDFPRGIFASVYLDCPLEEKEAVGLYEAYYADSPFVSVCDFNPDLKMVTGTNKALVHPRKYGSKLHIISCLDNLLKGAAGQAVENMNLMFGLPRDCGLRLKGCKF
ncbi:MAG: N-acetyl-gamma-glutamyl-phosphate reductase [Bacteroidales bacterium]|nr:N-acetyl-gamma-glutamyl-phosphate reductase [Candidatus Hennigimonas equi]